MSRHSKGIGLLGHTARGAAVGLAGLAGGYLSLGAAKGAVDTTVKLAKGTRALSRNLGLSTEQASRWAAVSTARGVDTDQLASSFAKLGVNVHSALNGSTKTAGAFKGLGISQKDLVKGSKDFNGMIGMVADGLGRMKGGSDRAAAAQAVLGRSSANTLPIFTQGRKSMNENLKLADKYGLTLGGKPIKSLGQLMQTQKELEFAQLGFQVQFATKIAPKLIQGFNMILKAGNKLRPAFAFFNDHSKIAATTAALLGLALVAPRLLRTGQAGMTMGRGIVTGGRLGITGLRRVLGGARGLARQLLGGAGSAGGTSFASRASTAAGSSIGPSFNRQGTKFRTAGNTAGGQFGRSAGSTAGRVTARDAGSVISKSARGGVLATAMKGAGLLAATAFVDAYGPQIRSGIDNAFSKIPGNRKSGLESGARKGASDTQIVPGVRVGDIQKLGKKFNPGGIFGHASGGLVSPAGRRSVVPPGEDTVRGLRYGEFVMRKSAVQRHGVGALQAMNRGNITMPDRVPVDLGGLMANSAGGGSPIYVEVKLGEKVLMDAIATHVDRKTKRR